jgi:hypothetical protein
MTEQPFAREIADLIAVGILPSGATPATITQLVLNHVRDLTALDQFPLLEGLSVSGAQGVDYSDLATPPLLHVLTIENTTLATMGGAVAPELRVANIRRNRVTDIGALANHVGLQVLDVSGNPLSPESVTIAERLRTRGVVLTIDDPTVIELNRDLAAAHPDLVCYGTAQSCFLTVTGLDRTDAPERIAVPVSAARVRELIGDDAGFTNLIDTRWEGQAQ